jgi:hypothetical protein
VFEFDRGILSGKTPVDGGLLLITSRSPGGNLPFGDLQGGQPLRQALTIQNTQFNLGHVELASMLWGVMHLKALTQTTRFGDWKHLVKGSKGMRIEIIHHSHDLFHRRIVRVCQLADELVQGLLAGLQTLA